MHPVLFRAASFAVESYPVFVGLGFVTGGILFVREVRRRGWRLEPMLFLVAGCLVGSFVGSRLLVVLFVPWSEFVPRLLSLDLSGRTIIGGLAGGYAGVELTKLLLHHRTPTGDAFAVAIPAGAAIGRIGCLAGGCCFGIPTALPWGITYPAGSPAWAAQVAAGRIGPDAVRSLPVHPTQVYEALFDVLLVVVLSLLRSRLRAPASLFRLYLVLYCLYRFLSEFLRGDSAVPPGGGLKTVQLVLIPAVLLFSFLLWRNELRPAPAGRDQGGAA